MHDEPIEKPLRILHLEDSAVDHELVLRALHRASRLTIDRVETLEEFDQMVRDFAFDAIVADYRLRGFTAIDAWELLKQHEKYPPFILLSGAIGESAAVAAIKLGMSDYLQKDDVGKLAHTIHRAIEMQETRLAKDRADAELAISERRLANLPSTCNPRLSRNAPRSPGRSMTISAEPWRQSSWTWPGSAATCPILKRSAMSPPPTRCCNTHWEPASE